MLSLSLCNNWLTWLQSLLRELHIDEAHAPIIFTNNNNVKFLVANPIMSWRMKHVKIDFYFICDLVINNKIDIRYIHRRTNGWYHDKTSWWRTFYSIEDQAYGSTSTVGSRGAIRYRVQLYCNVHAHNLYILF